MRRPSGIVCFDLDGTLLRRPTICEILAIPLGHSKDMVRIEALISEVEIAEARSEMVGWYLSTPRDQLRAWVTNVNWAPGAREAVAELQAAGLEVAIASYTWLFAVEMVAKELRVAHCIGSSWQPDGTIEHVFAKDKAAWLVSLIQEYDVPRERTAAVGDSRGDIEMLSAVGLPIAVGEHSLPEVPHVRHMPRADLREVAQVIVEEWSR